MDRSSASRTDVSTLLLAWNQGDPAALERLIPLVYRDLRTMARKQMRAERDGHTLQASALVHEAYLRLVRDCPQFNGRAHFFGIAAHLMRQILVDYARSRASAKRGSGRERVSLHDSLEHAGAIPLGRPEETLAIDEALTRLAALDARKSQVVELRFFAGLSVEETAEALHVSTKTVVRDWNFARTWLHKQIQ